MKARIIYSIIAASLMLSAPVMACPMHKDGKHASKQDLKDIDATLNDWKTAVESASADDIMKLYDKQAIMISTFAQHPLVKREEIADYYKKIASNPDLHVEINETHPRLFGDVAVDSGLYTISYTQEGEAVAIPARFTFVYVMENGKWLIVEQHSSRVPLPESMKE